MLLSELKIFEITYSTNCESPVVHVFATKQSEGRLKRQLNSSILCQLIFLKRSAALEINFSKFCLITDFERWQLQHCR